MGGEEVCGTEDISLKVIQMLLEGSEKTFEETLILESNV